MARPLHPAPPVAPDGAVAIGDAFRLTAAGLVVSGTPTFDEWQACGQTLFGLSNASLWAIGDWIVYGEGRGDWGEMYSQAVDATQKSYDTVQRAAWVSEAFQLRRRRRNLSWSHHREVAGLPEPEQDRWLDVAAREGLSRTELRERVRDARHATLSARPLPPGRYQVLYADPPWRYDHVETASRAIENQYPTMRREAICALAVPAADDAVLFLWATSPKLAEALSVVDAWGFTYRTCAVWDKERIGMGYYFRQQHELLLVAARGSLPVPQPATRPSSVIRARRGTTHSEKPQTMYDLLERMYPRATKLELFARLHRDGWDAWGHQAA